MNEIALVIFMPPSCSAIEKMNFRSDGAGRICRLKSGCCRFRDSGRNDKKGGAGCSLTMQTNRGVFACARPKRPKKRVENK